MPEQLLEYCIDQQDRICRVDQGWTAFAETDGCAEVMAEAVLGRPVYDFIVDLASRVLYRTLYHRVRQGATITLPLRCDSPGKRRHLRLRLSLTAEGLIRTEVFLLAQEPRTAIPLLDPTRPRSAARVLMCSWCLTVRLDGQWRELEEVRDDPRLGSPEQVPRIEYDLCRSCLTAIYPESPLPV